MAGETALAAQKIALSATGVLATQNAAAATSTKNKVANPNGNICIVCRNGSGADITVTFEATQTVSGAALAVPDLTADVVAGTARLFGPFDKATWNDSAGDIVFYPSLETSVTFEVYQI